MMRKNAMYIMVHRVNMKELYLLSEEHGDKVGFRVFAKLHNASKGT